MLQGVCVNPHTRAQGTQSSEIQDMYPKAYKVLCEDIIKKRLINNHEVFRLTKLIHFFKLFVKKHDGVELLNYKSFLLKHRLQREFPQLIFHLPPRRNISQLVFTETLSTGTVVIRFKTESSTELTEEQQPKSVKKMHLALHQKIEAPSPVGHGWKMDHDLWVVWMTVDLAPESVVRVISCRCKQLKCESGRCSCRSCGLSYTTCVNVRTACHQCCLSQARGRHYHHDQKGTNFKDFVILDLRTLGKDKACADWRIVGLQDVKI